MTVQADALFAHLFRGQEGTRTNRRMRGACHSPFRKIVQGLPSTQIH